MTSYTQSCEVEGCGHELRSEVPIPETWKHYHGSPRDAFMAAEAERGRQLHGAAFVMTGLEALDRPLAADDFIGLARRIAKTRIAKDIRVVDLERQHSDLKAARSVLPHEEYREVIRRIRPTLLSSLRFRGST